MTPTEFSTTDLNQLHRQLTAWRRRQQGRTRLPEAVWQSAASVARCQGVSRVSRKLRLSYYRLSRLTGQAKGPSCNRPTAPGFVELALSPAKAIAGGGYRVELEAMGGHRMTVDLGADVRALVALAEAFWRRRS